MIPVGKLQRKLRRKLGRKRYGEVLDMALNKVSNFTVERNPLTVSGIVEGTLHYSSYIDETGEYCCSCVGQSSHKTICKHILALTIYGYLNSKISGDEMIKLIGGEIR
jgi:hypothetical protein